MSDIDDLKRRAAGGDAEAQYAAGARLLVGRDAPMSPIEGGGLVRAAAAQGQPDALCLMAAIAGYTQNWAQGIAFLKQAAEKGAAAAARQLQILSGMDPAVMAAPAQVDWRRGAPRVGVSPAFLPPSMCDYLIDRARPRLDGARVNDPEKGGARAAEHRTNSGTGFSFIETDLVMQLAHARIAATIGLPIKQQEPTNILHYAPGEEYKPHFDFIDPHVVHFAQELNAMGQRCVTFLVYLNDGFDGGETDFPRLDWRFKGRAGDALVFWNTDETGQPDKRTLHAGLAPTRGEKWLLSKWVRNRPLPLL